LRIVFHGENAAAFTEGFAGLLGVAAGIAILPDTLTKADRRDFAAADVIIGTRFTRTSPRPERLRLFHVPGAGYDAVDLGALPPGVVVCNCFGRETGIAEFVMAALLSHHVPLAARMPSSCPSRSPRRPEASSTAQRSRRCRATPSSSMSATGRSSMSGRSMMP
jgi:phosphoglycerate dehydrogenase-like enzyme